MSAKIRPAAGILEIEGRLTAQDSIRIDGELVQTRAQLGETNEKYFYANELIETTSGTIPRIVAVDTSDPYDSVSGLPKAKIFNDVNTDRIIGVSVSNTLEDVVGVCLAYGVVTSNIDTTASAVNVSVYADPFNGQLTLSNTGKRIGTVLTLAINGKILIDINIGTPAGASDLTGFVVPFASTIAPTGWLACDGSAVSRTTYANLFASIGTTHGAGNGSTTFNLPDIRGIYVRGSGTHGTMQMATGIAFNGGSVGATRNDQFQGHRHIQGFGSSGGDGARFGRKSGLSGITSYYDYDIGAGSGTMTDAAYTSLPDDDGTNGTPRTGDETRPASISLLYCIKT